MRSRRSLASQFGPNLPGTLPKRLAAIDQLRPLALNAYHKNQPFSLTTFGNLANYVNTIGLALSDIQSLERRERLLQARDPTSPITSTSLLREALVSELESAAARFDELKQQDPDSFLRYSKSVDTVFALQQQVALHTQVFDTYNKVMQINKTNQSTGCGPIANFHRAKAAATQKKLDLLLADSHNQARMQKLKMADPQKFAEARRLANASPILRTLADKLLYFSQARGLRNKIDELEAKKVKIYDSVAYAKARYYLKDSQASLVIEQRKLKEGISSTYEVKKQMEEVSSNIADVKALESELADCDRELHKAKLAQKHLETDMEKTVHSVAKELSSDGFIQTSCEALLHSQILDRTSQDVFEEEAQIEKKTLITHSTLIEAAAKEGILKLPSWEPNEFDDKILADITAQVQAAQTGSYADAEATLAKYAPPAATEETAAAPTPK